MGAQSFEEAIAVTPLTSHTYSAHLHEEWCIGTVPHGGYISALFHHVARTHLQRNHAQYHNGNPSPMSVHLTFLRRTEEGAATFEVEDAKLGARTSTLHVRLIQQDPDGGRRVEVVAFITCSDLATEEGVRVQTDWQLSPPPTRGSKPNGKVDLHKLETSGRDTNWTRYETPFTSFRKASQWAEIYIPTVKAGEGSGRRGLVEQWARFKPYGHYQNWTDDSLAYLIDMFPMLLGVFDDHGKEATGSSAARFWYPTVCLNVDTKKSLGHVEERGAKWLYSRIQTKVVQSGRMDIDIVIMNEAGEVVALSNHIALVLSAARNKAARKSKSQL